MSYEWVCNGKKIDKSEWEYVDETLAVYPLDDMDSAIRQNKYLLLDDAHRSQLVVVNENSSVYDEEGRISSSAPNGIIYVPFNSKNITGGDMLSSSRKGIKSGLSSYTGNESTRWANDYISYQMRNAILRISKPLRFDSSFDRETVTYKGFPIYVDWGNVPNLRNEKLTFVSEHVYIGERECKDVLIRHLCNNTYEEKRYDITVYPNSSYWLDLGTSDHDYEIDIPVESGEFMLQNLDSVVYKYYDYFNVDDLAELRSLLHVEKEETGYNILTELKPYPSFAITDFRYTEFPTIDKKITDIDFSFYVNQYPDYFKSASIVSPFVHYFKQFINIGLISADWKNISNNSKNTCVINLPHISTDRIVNYRKYLVLKFNSVCHMLLRGRYDDARNELKEMFSIASKPFIESIATLFLPSVYDVLNTSRYEGYNKQIINLIGTVENPDFESLYYEYEEFAKVSYKENDVYRCVIQYQDHILNGSFIQFEEINTDFDIIINLLNYLKKKNISTSYILYCDKKTTDRTYNKFPNAYDNYIYALDHNYDSIVINKEVRSLYSLCFVNLFIKYPNVFSEYDVGLFSALKSYVNGKTLVTGQYEPIIIKDINYFKYINIPITEALKDRLSDKLYKLKQYLSAEGDGRTNFKWFSSRDFSNTKDLVEWLHSLMLYKTEIKKFQIDYVKDLIGQLINLYIIRSQYSDWTKQSTDYKNITYAYVNEYKYEECVLLNDDQRIRLANIKNNMRRLIYYPENTNMQAADFQIFKERIDAIDDYNNVYTHFKKYFYISNDVADIINDYNDLYSLIEISDIGDSTICNFHNNICRLFSYIGHNIETAECNKKEISDTKVEIQDLLKDRTTNSIYYCGKAAKGLMFFREVDPYPSTSALTIYSDNVKEIVFTNIVSTNYVLTDHDIPIANDTSATDPLDCYALDNIYRDGYENITVSTSQASNSERCEIMKRLSSSNDNVVKTWNMPVKLKITLRSTHLSPVNFAFYSNSIRTDKSNVAMCRCLYHWKYLDWNSIYNDVNNSLKREFTSSLNAVDMVADDVTFSNVPSKRIFSDLEYFTDRDINLYYARQQNVKTDTFKPNDTVSYFGKSISEMLEGTYTSALNIEDDNIVLKGNMPIHLHYTRTVTDKLQPFTLLKNLFFITNNNVSKWLKTINDSIDYMLYEIAASINKYENYIVSELFEQWIDINDVVLYDLPVGVCCIDNPNNMMSSYNFYGTEYEAFKQGSNVFFQVNTIENYVDKVYADLLTDECIVNNSSDPAFIINIPKSQADIVSIATGTENIRSSKAYSTTAEDAWNYILTNTCIVITKQKTVSGYRSIAKLNVPRLSLTRNGNKMNVKMVLVEMNMYCSSDLNCSLETSNDTGKQTILMCRYYETLADEGFMKLK